MGLLGGQSGPRVGSGPVGSIPTPVNAAICQQRGGFHGVERGYSAGDSGVLTSLGDNERTMNFYSAYQHGFVRVAACTHHTTIGDPAATPRRYWTWPVRATTMAQRWRSFLS